MPRVLVIEDIDDNAELFERVLTARGYEVMRASDGETGLQMALDPRIDPAKLHYGGLLPYHPNPLIVIGGLVLGGIAGELLQLERGLERIGQRLHGLAPRAGERLPGVGPTPPARPLDGGCHRPNQTTKEEPQPQERFTFGLRSVKPEAMSSSL